MSNRKLVTLITGVILAAAANTAWAQHGPGHAASPPQKRPSMEQPDTMQDRDRTQQQDMDQDRLRDQDQDRALLRDQDRDRIRDQDIYGTSLMSAEEREQYRERLAAARSDQEWARLQAEHEVEMQTRAQARGEKLDPPIYGQHMMTVEERARFTERMQAADSDAERERVMSEHREFIRNRTRELEGEEAPVRH